MIAPTPRARMSEKRRQHIFSENCTGHHVAPCVNCGRPIHRHNDAWIIEHKRALGLLGQDTNTNCGPSHVRCGIEKTAKQDIPAIAKAKRQHIRSVPNRLKDKGSSAHQGPEMGFSDRGPEQPYDQSVRLKKKKPARAFQVPAGVSYDWRQRRYIPWNREFG